MKPDDYCYRLLGVSRYASQDALRRAFHRRLLSLHPDRNPGDELANERTRKLIEAYKTLSDPRHESHSDLASASTGPPPRRFEAPTRLWLSHESLLTLGGAVLVILLALALARIIVADCPRACQPLADDAHRRVLPARPALRHGGPDRMRWYMDQRRRPALASGRSLPGPVRVHIEPAWRIGRECLGGR